MSFKSMIQDMRGEFGSISRKGFEGRFGYGMRSRSQRVVEEFPVSAVDALRQSCWANMPPELLRDVLMRIEESEGTWPPRKNVVACAGVCRSWRETMKEIVRTLEVSEKLTFPISLKQVCILCLMSFVSCMYLCMLFIYFLLHSLTSKVIQLDLFTFDHEIGLRISSVKPDASRVTDLLLY